MPECQPKRKSKTPNKNGICLLIPFFIVCVLFVILWRRQGTDHFVADLFETINKPTSADFQNRVCTNQDCVSAAALIIQNMDYKADPCNDTVAFACGNYRLHHDPLNTDGMDPSIDLALRIRREIVAILTQPSSPGDKPWHVLTKTFYQKCVNKPEIDATAKKALLALLEEIGGWPLLDPHWTEFTTSWEEYIAMVYRKFDVGAVVLAAVNVNPENRSELVLQLHPQPLRLGFFSPSYFNSIALFLGAKDGSFNGDLETFSHINTNLQTSQAKSGDEKVIGPLYLVQRQFPNFNVEKYVRAVLDGIVEVSPNTTVVVNNKGYFANLHKIISSKRDLANYVGGSVAMTFRSQPFGHFIELQTDSEHDLWCYYGATDYFKRPLAQMFLQNSNFDVEVRPKVNEMVKNIKEALHDAIRDATWLDEGTRQNALKKADAMEYSIGYPENLYNETLLRQHYNIAPSNSSEHFYAFLARLYRQQTTASLSQHELTALRMGFIVASPVIPNAYYDPKLNKLFIHVGKIQFPFFSPNLPDYVNYARLGHTVGHELQHAFGIEARGYDHEGVKRNWWSDESATKYDNLMECFVEQYNGYGVDGRRTLEENMADNVGLVLAYNAYKKKVSKHPDYAEPALPGLEKFTLDQIFFITATSTNCALDPSTGLNPNSPYTPEKLRIFGPLQNMKELSVAFNCPENSKMNPKNRCSVW